MYLCEWVGVAGLEMRGIVFMYMVGNIQEDFQLKQALSWNSGQTLTGSLWCFPEKVNHWDALRNMQQELASSITA